MERVEQSKDFIKYAEENGGDLTTKNLFYVIF